MSMFSIVSSWEAPRATVCSKGYRFTQTRSMGLPPMPPRASRSSPLSRMRIPPCTRGCSVFTRPSMISGDSVYSETSMTGTPPSRSALAVPPVERISTPASESPFANSTTPDLSETEISARLICVMPLPSGRPVDL